MLRDPRQRLLHPARHGLLESAGVPLADGIVQIAEITHEARLGRRCRQHGFHLSPVLGRQLAVHIGVQLGFADAALGHHLTLRSAA